MQKNRVLLNFNWGKRFVNHKLHNLTTFFLVLTLLGTVDHALSTEHVITDFQ